MHYLVSIGGAQLLLLLSSSSPCVTSARSYNNNNQTVASPVDIGARVSGGRYAVYFIIYTLHIYIIRLPIVLWKKEKTPVNVHGNRCRNCCALYSLSFSLHFSHGYFFTTSLYTQCVPNPQMTKRRQVYTASSRVRRRTMYTHITSH